MRGAVLGILAGTALAFGATTANAAVVVSSPGQSCTGVGCTTGITTVVPINQLTMPNTIVFDTSGIPLLLPQPSGTTNTGWFNFMLNYDAQGIFTLGASTIPNSTVQLVELLTGSPLAVVGSAGPSPNSITYTTGLLTAGTTYQFRYTVGLGSPGNISGNAAFYPVPEPATWALMLLGFGGIGIAMRRRRRPAFAQIA